MSDTFTGADFAEPLGDTSTQAGSVEPSATVDTTAQPGAATTEPAVSAAAPPSIAPVQKPGPIPFENHERILKNAREKASEEALAKWKEQYGWAEQVDREQVAQAVQIAQRYQQDPAGYIRELLTEAIANPQLAQAVRSDIARALGQRSSAPQPVDLTPIPVEMTDGQTRNLYTAEQFQAALQQQVAKLREEFQPAVQTAEELQRERHTAERQRQADTFAKGAFAEFQQLPGFEEHKAEIAKVLAQAKLQTDHPAEVKAATYKIYASLVLPKLASTERRAMLTDQHAAAAANTVNPARTSTSAPKSMDDMTIAEALAAEAARMSA